MTYDEARHCGVDRWSARRDAARPYSVRPYSARPFSVGLGGPTLLPFGNDMPRFSAGLAPRDPAHSWMRRPRSPVYGPRSQCRSIPPALLLALLLAFASAARAQAPAKLQPQKPEALTYVLTPDFGRGRLKVEITWATHGRTSSALSVSPHFGRIDDVSALLKNVRIHGDRNVNRQGALWLVSHARDAQLGVSYEIALGRNRFDDWEEQHLPLTTPEFFHGVGSAFLMTPNSHPGTPATFETALRWVLPAGWKGVSSWGGVTRSAGAPMPPSDLRQSVYFAGKLETRTIKEDGLVVSVAMAPGFDFSIDEFAEFTTRIIKAETKFVREPAFPPFVVTAMPAGPPIKEGESRVAGSGLYHGFALYLAPRSTLTDGVQSLFAHELFHQWNGRLLPGADPERLVYWFTEGFTEYYALRILYESGIWDAKTYAKWLNRHLREYAENPARNATNGEIDARYWTDRDTVGQVAYQRGVLLGLRWNALAKKQGTRSGVDAWFFGLLEAARGTTVALTNDRLRQTGVVTFGAWFGPEFDRHVRDAVTIDVPADALAPALHGRLEKIVGYDLGFDRGRSLAERKICGLRAGSAAAAAGLREGDALAAWNITGDPATLTRVEVRRDGKSMKFEFHARGATHDVLQFSP